MSVTKEQWAAVEKELSGPYGEVELLCDGYKVTAQIQNIANLKQGIVVYVNGVIKGEWMKGEAEESRKFHREMKRYLYPAKHREEAKQKAKSRRFPADLRKYFADMATASITTWAPYWTNAKAFTRQLRKTCAEIQVVTIRLNGLPS
jgi:hypothetical protein